jgi:hypothetical protein
MALQVHTNLFTGRHYLVVDGVMDEEFSDMDEDNLRSHGQLLVDTGLAYWF